MHDRIEDYITEETCKAEIESFLSHGQLVPVLGRGLLNDPDYEAELIYGARRLFVARSLNVELLVEMRDVSDRDAIIVMDIENRHRSDISPYERGLSYSRWLRQRYFASQDDIARALNVSTSQISRLLKLARLPTVIIDAFGSAVHLREAWGLQLALMLDDQRTRHRVLAIARSIAGQPGRPPPEEVYKRLLAGSLQGRKPRKLRHDEVVKADDGTPLFRIRHQRSSVALLLPLQSVSAAKLETVQQVLKKLLQSMPGRVQGSSARSSCLEGARPGSCESHDAS